jgi:hypothetical protein
VENRTASKTCSGCGETKPLEQFYRQKTGRYGRQGLCIPCHRAKNKAYRSTPEGLEANRRRSREYYWRNIDRLRIQRNSSNQGVTEDDYRLALIAQDGRCAICGNPPAEGRKGGPNKSARLHIDHDHAAGRFRGLLCHLCNIGLGHFRDDPELLTKAAAYLITSKEEPQC